MVSGASREPTVENGWNGESSPVQVRLVKVVRTRRWTLSRMPGKQKGAYSSQPLTPLEKRLEVIAQSIARSLAIGCANSAKRFYSHCVSPG